MENMELVLQELRKINGRLDALEGKMDRIQGDVTGLQEDVTELKEAHEVTRDGVNVLIEWAEDVSNAIRFPLPKLK